VRCKKNLPSIYTDILSHGVEENAKHCFFFLATFLHLCLLLLPTSSFKLFKSMQSTVSNLFLFTPFESKTLLFTPFESKTQIYMVIDNTFHVITNYAIYFFSNMWKIVYHSINSRRERIAIHNQDKPQLRTHNKIIPTTNLKKISTSYLHNSKSCVTGQ
jgi:hypothetical protein